MKKDPVLAHARFLQQHWLEMSLDVNVDNGWRESAASRSKRWKGVADQLEIANQNRKAEG